MPAQTARRSRVAIAVVAAVTASGAFLLTGCGTTGAKAASAAGASTPATAPAGSSQPVRVASAAAPAVNGTAHNGLTISNGTEYVVMNGTRVDFHTLVRDLAWSPNGKKAAFVDGSGNLDTANPDGSGRVTVAKNPGGQVWSHPTWQVTASGDPNGVPAKDNILFTASIGGVTRLDIVSAKAVDGTAKKAGVNAPGGDKSLPQTHNAWPNIGGRVGDGVYANSANGEVYIRDDYLRQQGGVVTPGSEPAMSPTTGEEIVFVRASGGHDHLFLEKRGDSGYGKPIDLTPHATTDYTEPAWSPNGATIAARTPSGIVTLPANGSAKPVRISTYTGLPAYRG